MRKAINYTDIFNFFFSPLIAVFEDYSEEQLAEDCYAMNLVPVTYIRDSAHPLFNRLQKEFKNQGVIQDLKVIVLSIGYTKQFLT